MAALFATAILLTASSLLTATATRGGITAYAQEEAFTLDIEIDSASWDPRTKQVTVEFTARCSEPADGSWFVEVTQSLGKKVISGDAFGPDDLGCDEEGDHNTAKVEADDGFFVPRPALIRLNGVASGVFDGDDDTDVEKVLLKVRLFPRG